ncbi:uncharacterized protein PAC_16454 [Phialocephala subalpina]|uniref:Uncharacterized protein n=1 Tax=Phialocephala subalpina TaxID=576137 RepID=A0A1L7XNE4_9HELO|nr:uncharacterized protein PAC_16454 [Phialocephala subalpina]
MEIRSEIRQPLPDTTSFLDSTCNISAAEYNEMDPACRAGCPFPHSGRGQAQQTPPSRKAFRLQEISESGTVHNRFPFGDGIYQEFPPDCVEYHIADIYSPHSARHFVFSAFQTTSDMTIVIHSSELLSAVNAALWNCRAYDLVGSLFTRFLLWDRLYYFKQYLASVSRHPFLRSSDHILEMELLVKGCLAGINPNRGIGLTILYEQQYRECLEEEQNTSFDSDVDILENMFDDSSLEELGTDRDTSVPPRQDQGMFSQSRKRFQSQAVCTDSQLTMVAQPCCTSPRIDSAMPVNEANDNSAFEGGMGSVCNAITVVYCAPGMLDQYRVRTPEAWAGMVNAANGLTTQNRINWVQWKFWSVHKEIRQIYRHQQWAQRYFSTPIANERRAAWSAGIKVMRKLAKRDVSSHTVGEIVMLLAVVKCISIVKDVEDPITPNRESKFNGDLDRWQMIFASDEAKLMDFRQIIKLLWNIELKDWSEVPPDTVTSSAFKVLVKALVADAAPFFRTATRRDQKAVSVFASQERWWLERQQFLNLSQESPKPPPERSKPPWAEAQDLSSREEAAQESDLQSAPTHCPPTPNSYPLIPLLLAGAIFGIFLAFLIGLKYLRSYASSNHESLPSNENFGFLSNLQTPVIQSALQHVTSVLKTTNLVPLGTIILLRTESELAITSLRMTSLSELITWLKEYVLRLGLDEDTLTGFQSYIQAFNDNWTSTYDVQANYRLLEIYLGIKDFASIVPHTLLRTESLEARDLDDVRTEPATASTATTNLSNGSNVSISPARSTGMQPSATTVSDCNSW